MMEQFPPNYRFSLPISNYKLGKIFPLLFIKENRMSGEYAKDHFATNRWILRCAGLWAPETPSKLTSFLYNSYALFVFLFVNLYFTFTEFLCIRETSGNLDLLIKNINFALTHLMGAVKCIFWYCQGHKLIQIIQCLEDKKFHYESANDFDPYRLSIQAKQTGTKYTLAFLLLAHLTVSSSYIPSVFTAAFNPNYENVNGTLKFQQQLPYFSWIPFSYDTPKTYILATIYQAGPMLSYAYSIVGMDTLFMNIMNYIGFHLRVLKGAFKSLRGRSRGETDEGLEMGMTVEMKKSIVHLQTVIEMCGKLENTHKYLTLGQIMATLFILCTSLFLVSTTPIASKQFAAESVYMIAMGFQLVLYCWFGNQVTLCALEIPQSIWEGDWLNTKKSFKTLMLITMIRMKKPLHLTVGKFAPLTLPTFVAILKASYSFFAVLKKVND